MTWRSIPKRLATGNTCGRALGAETQPAAVFRARGKHRGKRRRLRMEQIFDRMLRCLLLACLPGISVFAQPAPRPFPAPQALPTGMSITPTAAPGSRLLFLNPDLPGMPEHLADHPIATALSPDGRTLLVLTSGFNRVYDIKAKIVPELSSEYVFVLDVTRNPPVKRQALPVPNTFMGMAWAPDGRQFFVAGGQDDNIHVFSQKLLAQDQGGWAEELPAISLGHQEGLGINEEEGAKDHKNTPLAAGVAVSRDGKRLLVAN